MINLAFLSCIIVSISVFYVWIFRFHNVISEFKQFGLSDIVRNFVGVSKISLATLLIVCYYYQHNTLLLISASSMAMFMFAAQLFHFRIRNSFFKHLPSFLLLVLCIVVIANTIK